MSANEKELYEIVYILLGVKKDSSVTDIKKAFKRRAVELHPDRADVDPDLFVALSKAYEILMEDSNEDPQNEKPEIPDLKELAKVKIQKFFNDILCANLDERIFNSDMISNMKIFLKTDTVNIDKEIKNTKAKIKIFEKLQESITIEGEENFLVNIIEQHLLSFTKQISDCNRRKEINDIAIEMLGSFKFLIKL